MASLTPYNACHGSEARSKSVRADVPGIPKRTSGRYFSANADSILNVLAAPVYFPQGGGGWILVPMEFHGLDAATAIALALVSLVLTWMVIAYLDLKEEKRREKELRKVMDRLLLRDAGSSKEDSD